MATELWRPRSALGSALARRPFGGAARDFEDMITRFFDDRSWWLRASGPARGRMPAVDMFDRKDELVLRADLPGPEEKDVEVRVESGVLTLRGERWGGSFSRSMTLPPGIDVDKIKATFRNGVLEVRLPKAAQAAGRKIEIKAA